MYATIIKYYIPTSIVSKESAVYAGEVGAAIRRRSRPPITANSLLLPLPLSFGSRFGSGDDEELVGVFRKELFSLRMSPPGPFLLFFFGVPSFAASAKPSSLDDFKGIGAPGVVGIGGSCDNDIFCDVLLPRRDNRFQSGARCEDELSAVSRGGFGMLLMWGLFLLFLLLLVIVFAFLDYECPCACVNLFFVVW